MNINMQKLTPMGSFLRLLPLVVLFFGSAIFAADDVEKAGKAVNAFYDVYLHTKPASGVPTGSQLMRFNPVVSEELFSLLSKADEAEKYYMVITEGEAPPLVQGDLFTSLFEGAVGYELKTCEAKDMVAHCVVALTFVDPRDKSVVSWNDRVFLLRVGTRWLVDDIEYLGDWQFMHKGRLKTLLRQAIIDSRK